MTDHVTDQLEKLQKHWGKRRHRVMAVGAFVALQKWRPDAVRHRLILTEYRDDFHKYEADVETVTIQVDRLVTEELHLAGTLDSLEFFSDTLLPGGYVIDQHPGSTPTFVKVGWADSLEVRRDQHRCLAPMNDVVGFVPRLWTGLIPDALEGVLKAEGKNRWGRYGRSNEAFSAPSIEDVRAFAAEMRARLIVV